MAAVCEYFQYYVKWIRIRLCLPWVAMNSLNNVFGRIAGRRVMRIVPSGLIFAVSDLSTVET